MHCVFFDSSVAVAVLSPPPPPREFLRRNGDNPTNTTTTQHESKAPTKINKIKINKKKIASFFFFFFFRQHRKHTILKKHMKSAISFFIKLTRTFSLESLKKEVINLRSPPFRPPPPTYLSCSFVRVVSSLIKTHTGFDWFSFAFRSACCTTPPHHLEY